MSTIQQADLAAERRERSAAIDAAAKAIAHPLRRVAIGQVTNHGGTTSPWTIAVAIEMAAARDTRPGLGLGAVLSDAMIQVGARRRLTRVAYHVHVLEELGIIELDRTARRRGATQHYYRFAHTPAARLARSMLRATHTPTREDHR